MAFVTIPKDLTNVKTKIMFNLTKRQLICFSIAGAVGLPPFFLTKAYIGTSNAVLLMMFLMMPFFLLAMYEKHGQTLEVVVKNYINVKFRTPKYRPYMTDNYYNILVRQAKINKEVQSIAKETKPIKSREKTNSSDN